MKTHGIQPDRKLLLKLFKNINILISIINVAISIYNHQPRVSPERAKRLLVPFEQSRLCDHYHSLQWMSVFFYEIAEPIYEGIPGRMVKRDFEAGKLSKETMRTLSRGVLFNGFRLLKRRYCGKVGHLFSSPSTAIRLVQFYRGKWTKGFDQITLTKYAIFGGFLSWADLYWHSEPCEPKLRQRYISIIAAHLQIDETLLRKQILLHL